MLVQLSDLHLRPGDPVTEGNLERAVRAVADLDPRPAALLVTGDLADVPAPEVYARARELLEQPGLPLLVIPGNHDDRDLLRAAFGPSGDPPGAPVRLTARCGRLRVVAADTSRPGQAGGRLDHDDLAWLDAELAADADTPTVLALHHPPVLTGIGSLDAIGLPAADRVAVASLLERHSHVQLVTCGHVHRTMATKLGGAAVVICPGTSSQLRLELRPRDDLPIEMTGEPSGLAVHILVEGGIRSHFVLVPDD